MMVYMRSKILMMALWVGAYLFVGSAWAPIHNHQRRLSITTRKMHTDEEFVIRREVEAQNSLVTDEEQYAVADGEYLDKLMNVEVIDTSLPSSRYSPESSATTEATTEADSWGKSNADPLDQLTKPRAYPLFVAEKLAERMETTMQSFAKSWSPIEFESMRKVLLNITSKKENLLVLGTGWGSVSFLRSIDTEKFDVTVISPRNFFVFTPMLAGASVGTVEYRSITEPIREINRKAKYVEATVSKVDPKSKTVTCQSVNCDGNSCEVKEFTMSYDRLIVTVGAQTNAFGIPGVREYCCFLRQIEDARRIRAAIVNCFERAKQPSLSNEERRKILTFAVIGAGPTGIEFAAELRDFVEQDVPKYYPQMLKYVRIMVIQASSTVLASFDKSLQEEAIKQLSRPVEFEDPTIRALIPERFKLTELLLDSSVKEVGSDTIHLNDGTKIPYGLSVWAAGNGPLPLTLQLIDALGEEQVKEQTVARGRLAIDPWMRAIGSYGSIMAFGDCSCITNNQLPATAQVASQQGEYLAGIMNKQFDLSPPLSAEGIFLPPQRVPDRTEISLSDLIASLSTNNDSYAKPFQFLNSGILAYTGGATALAQVTAGGPNVQPILGRGIIGNALWRGVYFSNQVSWRNRLLLLNDWTKGQINGRDITNL